MAPLECDSSENFESLLFYSIKYSLRWLDKSRYFYNLLRNSLSMDVWKKTKSQSSFKLEMPRDNGPAVTFC